MKRLFILSAAVLFSGCYLRAQISLHPKREFRGVWVHVINQTQYQNMSSEEMKTYFLDMLNGFREDHLNAVLFQVRPTADAFYPSPLEPWSRYLRGKQGMAPDNDAFDPMAFMIEACHERNMEFHAWINPYRVTAELSDSLHPSHVFHRHPEWFVRYGNQRYFDPGLPDCRKFICDVIGDIVRRYDVDAIHVDDYFYPYPIPGKSFPDGNSFLRYGIVQGFHPEQKNDWRRNNINLLIREIRHTIVREKPWVRFGVSPFGIYRNKKSTPDGSGSDTNGLQNYDDLYADVKLWAEKGWIDYNIPQIYWNLGTKAADYEILIHWWNENSSGIPLYIGQDIARTMKALGIEQQLSRKMWLERNLPGISGNCFWPAYELMKNSGGIRDSLRENYHLYPALIPAYTHLHNKPPKDVRKLNVKWTEEGYFLHWERNGDASNPEAAQYFVIYRFTDKEKTRLDDPAHIVHITRDTQYRLPYEQGEKKKKYRYIVTSVDRFHNESRKGKSKKVKL
ncbi:MAG: family 10 glycosylhydrolase [Dysgonamonadaceae bacterium]|jgi:uncharacterized lipoprotein YddW (UPF0748 family)|nr:family 10 glycosylhydrolase [Dysgonamonadaceae bacterium]